MVNVFVFGATGFIGNSVAQSLRRAGHNVSGLARDAAKARTLASQEITPITGDIAKPETWLSAATESDIVIDISPSYGGISESIVDALVSSPRVTSRKTGYPKLAFIYFSGVWVYGNGTQRINDLIIPGSERAPDKPADIVGWRPAFEEKILGLRDKLDVFIVRPGMLFGYGASAIGAWWGPIAAAKGGSKDVCDVEAVGNVNITLVHQADLADATVKLVDKFEILTKMDYPVFSILSSVENIDSILKATASAMGYQGKLNYVAPTQAFTVALNSGSNVDGSRARKYLDWSPKHTSIVADIKIYVEAFLATAQG